MGVSVRSFSREHLGDGEKDQSLGECCKRVFRLGGLRSCTLLIQDLRL